MRRQQTLNRRCLNCMNIFQIPPGYEDDNFCCPHCGYIENTPPKVATHLFPGTVLANNFIVGTVLGAGGFGITYKAWNKALETVVAIKEYFPRGLVTRTDNTTVSVFSSEESESFEHGRQRFIREARNLVRFNNDPGTASIYEFFEENGTAYIVMEYLDGCTMKEYFKSQGAISDMNLIQKMSETVCDVLEQVHIAGFIHGDISPDNIFFCNNGSFKLIDFGAMKQNYNENNLTSTVLLKHGYAPSEQYSRSGNVGPWTDIYSYGATLYFLLTGTLPPDSIERLQDDDLVDPQSINPGINDILNNTILKAMAVKKDDRYQDVKELKDNIISGCQAGFVNIDDSKTKSEEEPVQPPIEEKKEEIIDNPFEEIEEIKKNDEPNEFEVIEETKKENRSHINEIDAHNDLTVGFKPEKVQKPAPTKQKKIIPIKGVLIAAIILCVVTGGIFFFILNRTPDVVGMQYKDAVDLLESKGFSVDVKVNLDNQGDYGIVKTEEKDGKQITISVNAPDFKGEDGTEAAEKLKTYIFISYLDSKTEFSDDVPENYVISEKVVYKDKPGIELIISKGPEEVVVPKIVGKTLKEAEKMLSEVGLKMESSYEFSDDVEKDVIIKQNIDADQKIKRGEKVTVVISNGPDDSIVEVPDLTGKSKEEAEELLDGLEIEFIEEYNSSVEAGLIFDQSEESGTKLKKGDKITLTISKGKEPEKNNNKQKTNNVNNTGPSPILAPEPATEAPTAAKEEEIQLSDESEDIELSDE